MILRPIGEENERGSAADLAAHVKNSFISKQQAASGYLPAWSVIARKQTTRADRYLLITQPDHAWLAGELAAQFHASFLPEVGSAMARAIGVHDDGWLMFEPERDYAADPMLLADGRPCSFIDVPIRDSIRAWRGSIEAAARYDGECIVAGHFLRLARGRLQSGCDAGEDLSALQLFVSDTERRQEERKPIAECIDLLQLCDTLSLYLCCGTTDAVEFPQRFGSEAIRARFEDAMYVTAPSLFGSPVRFTIAGRQFPTRETVQVEIRIR